MMIIDDNDNDIVDAEDNVSAFKKNTDDSTKLKFTSPFLSASSR